jgi:hypothetical protein
MAVTRYGNMARRVTPSRTNIVRTQEVDAPTAPASSAGNFRSLDQFFSGAAGAPRPSTLTQGPVAPVRQNLSSTPASTTPPVDIGQIVSDAISGINFGLNWPSVVSGGGGTTQSGQAALQNAAINQAKFLSEQASSAAAARAAQEAAARARLGVGAQAGALQGLLNTPTGTGSYREGADRLLGLLTGYETDARTGITGATTTARNLLGSQYGRASGLLFGAPAQGETAAITGAYPALTAYLQANAPTAYANVPTQPAPVSQNTLAQYMAGQGTGTAATDQEVAAQNVAAQAGQGNFAGLLDVLRRQETAGQTSRLNEAQQASTSARTMLEAQRAAQEGGITQQEQAALSTLAQALLGQRLGVEQGAEERRTGLQDTLTSLLGTGYNLTGEDIAEDIETAKVPAVAPSKAPKKVSERTLSTDWQRLVAKKNPNFTGTFNEAKKKFPKLYKQYLDSQKKK